MLVRELLRLLKIASEAAGELEKAPPIFQSTVEEPTPPLSKCSLHNLCTLAKICREVGGDWTSRGFVIF